MIPFFDQVRKVAAVVYVCVREDDGVYLGRVVGEMLVTLECLPAATLEKSTLQEQGVTINVQEVL
jgi:hypothetical protein